MISHIYIYIYTRVYIYIYICIYIHTCIHTYNVRSTGLRRALLAQARGRAGERRAFRRLCRVRRAFCSRLAPDSMINVYE